MKQSKVTSKAYLLVLAGFLCSSFSAGQALAQVSSISGKIIAEDDKGKYTRVSVQCRSHRNKLFLRKNHGESQWCDVTFGEFCDTVKLAAAQRVCSRQYASAVKERASQQATTEIAKESSAKKTKKKVKQKKSKAKAVAAQSPALDIEALKQEKFEIEQKTIELEARKLDLRRREIALRKRQIALARN